MKEQNIAILCSGVTLGVYNPALLIRNKLKSLGVNPSLYVCENLFYADKRMKISEMRKMFHRDFKFALMGQRVSKTVKSNYDPHLIDKLFTGWQQKGISRFIVFSGFWMSLLEDYFLKYPADNYCVDVYHMDAVNSESWRTANTLSENIRHIWFFSWDDAQIQMYIDISNQPVVPYNERRKRFIIHGGGWGIGTYKQKIDELTNAGISLDIINYEQNDISSVRSDHSYYMIDPGWNAWEPDETGNFRFPPFGKVIHGKIEYTENKEYQEVYNLIRQNQAVISKPGGATILDSLSSATPIAFLEPFGEYERRNAELMINAGLGIWYDDWKKAYFNTEILENCHINLINKRKSMIEYIEYFKTNYKIKCL